MKKIASLFLSVFLLVSFLAAKGGVGPCLATCCIGPRAGLEVNDGGRVSTEEWFMLVGDSLVLPALGLPLPIVRFALACEAGFGKSLDESATGKKIEVSGDIKRGGCTPFIASCCLGPRVGYELNDGRQVRNLEWLSLIVPVVPGVYMLYESFAGKTMSEVAQEERLDS